MKKVMMLKFRVDEVKDYEVKVCSQSSKWKSEVKFEVKVYKAKDYKVKI